MTNERIKQAAHTWNTIAKSFDKTRQYTWSFCDQYIKNLNANATCADLACGNGRHLLPITLKCKKAVGFDISTNLLKITEEKLKQNDITNTLLIQGDLCSLPFKNSIFDHILYIAALHNIQQKKNRIQSLNELLRVLKPKGTALVSVWSREQTRFKQKKFTQKKKMEPGDTIVYWRQHNLNIPRFYHLYKKDEFKEDLQKANFHIQTLKEVSIASKKSADNYYAIVEKNS